MSLCIHGCAAPFNEPMREIRGGWRPTFAAEAFDAALGRFDVPLWINHKGRRGRTDVSSDLRLHATTTGLFFWARIDHEIWKAIVTTALDNRRLRGVSVAWVNDHGTRDAATGLYTIASAELTEISLIVGDREPAFSHTWATYAN